MRQLEEDFCMVGQKKITELGAIYPVVCTQDQTFFITWESDELASQQIANAINNFARVWVKPTVDAVLAEERGWRKELKETLQKLLRAVKDGTNLEEAMVEAQEMRNDND